MPEKNRPTPAGREIGFHLHRLIAPVIDQLTLEGEPDTRCASCAFRLGTVPNGCPQTQLDALKCVLEGVPFFCHMHPGDEPTTICHGWYAARVGLKRRTTQVPWAFTPLEEEG